VKNPFYPDQIELEIRAIRDAQTQAAGIADSVRAKAWAIYMDVNGRYYCQHIAYPPLGDDDTLNSMYDSRERAITMVWMLNRVNDAARGIE
jgi:hypothetical protein